MTAVLDCRAISRSFGGLRALDDVSLVATGGELVGLIGPNGAGKSTLFAVIGGQLSTDSGTVMLNDVDITGAPAHRRARLGIGRTFQIPQLFPDLTALDNVLVGALQRWRTAPATEKAMQALDRVGLAAVSGRRGSTLGTTDAKRLEVAKALIFAETLLLVDEPMAGLTRAEADHIGELLRTLARDGLAVVLVEHSLEAIKAYADTVYVLASGAVLAAGSPTDVLDRADVRVAYTGVG